MSWPNRTYETLFAMADIMQRAAKLHLVRSLASPAGPVAVYTTASYLPVGHAMAC